MSNITKLRPRQLSNKEEVSEKKGSKWMSLLTWFLVSAILAYVVLYSWNPEYLQKKDELGKRTGVSDPMMTLLASVVVGLIVAVIVWLVQRK
jgi:hypothetical protein